MAFGELSHELVQTCSLWEATYLFTRLLLKFDFPNKHVEGIWRRQYRLAGQTVRRNRYLDCGVPKHLPKKLASEIGKGPNLMAFWELSRALI